MPIFRAEALRIIIGDSVEVAEQGTSSMPKNALLVHVRGAETRHLEEGNGLPPLDVDLAASPWGQRV